MILSIHSSGAFQIANGWPKFWPPVQLPPPSPLSAAATLLWQPWQSEHPNDAATAQVAPASPYPTRISPDVSGNFQMTFIDQRIALMRYDASHGPDNVSA
jgi:hypothetical protein